VVTAATIADHVVAHGGDWNAFRFGKLQSLCKRCHDNKALPGWRGCDDAVGADGLMIDPRHPLNRIGRNRDGSNAGV
jgi:5-methylcytosine-specific restriction protein A